MTSEIPEIHSWKGLVGEIYLVLSAIGLTLALAGPIGKSIAEFWDTTFRTAMEYSIWAGSGMLLLWTFLIPGLVYLAAKGLMTYVTPRLRCITEFLQGKMDARMET